MNLYRRRWKDIFNVPTFLFKKCTKVFTQHSLVKPRIKSRWYKMLKKKMTLNQMWIDFDRELAQLDINVCSCVLRTQSDRQLIHLVGESEWENEHWRIETWWTVSMMRGSKRGGQIQCKEYANWNSTTIKASQIDNKTQFHWHSLPFTSPISVRL